MDLAGVHDLSVNVDKNHNGMKMLSSSHEGLGIFSGTN